MLGGFHNGKRQRKLTDDQVRHIRKARKAGVSSEELQDLYGVCRSVIDKVARYASYTDVFDEDEME